MRDEEKTGTVDQNPFGNVVPNGGGMQCLLAAVRDLSNARSLQDVQRIVRVAARELTGCDGATFVLRDNGKCYYADEDSISPLWKGSRFPMEICISGWAMLNRQSVVIPDIYQDVRIPHAAYRPTFVKSLAMVPIRQSDPIGAIGNYWAHEHEPSDQEMYLLQALADFTSIAIDNAQLFCDLEHRVRERTVELEKANSEIQQLAVTDELTGLSNRRGLNLLSQALIRTARRAGTPCWVAYLDVNGLKEVNDTLGHDRGDELIVDVARALQSTLRESDVAARLGGDEFCVLTSAPDCDAIALRRRLYEAFEAVNERAQSPYRLSVSVGIVQMPVDGGGTLDDALAAADELMYTEKSAARGSDRRSDFAAAA